MLIDALHPALENGEVSFDRVGMNGAVGKAHMLAAAVVDRAVTGVLAAYVGIEAALVRHELALAVGVPAEDRLHGVAVGAVHVKGAGLAAALDQADHGALARQPRLAVLGACRDLFLVAEVGLASLDGLALAAKAARIVGCACHRLAQAMSHEPSRLVAEPQRAVELVGARALLSG